MFRAAHRPLVHLPFPTLLVCLLAGLCRAQTWDDTFDRPGLVGEVLALENHNGDLIAGGKVLQADGRFLTHIARFDGVSWQPIGGGIPGEVHALCIYNGDLVAAGEFSGFGGQIVGSIVRWNGTQWQPLGTGLQPPFGIAADVMSLAVYNGELYAGGRIGGAGGAPVNGIARWNGSQWSSVGTGLNAGFDPRVMALAVHGNTLYAGGVFDGAGGVASPNIAAWDGTSWSAVGGGTSSAVTALESFQGKLYVGGLFGTAGGVTARRIATWNGASWAPVGQGIPDFSVTATVHSLKAIGTDLYVGGGFERVDSPNSWGGIVTRSVARFDGVQWHGVGGIDGRDLHTRAFALTAWRGMLVVGGEFTRAGTTLAWGQTTTSTGIVAFDGSAWRQINRGLGLNERVSKMTIWNGGIVAVGRFFEAGRSLTSPVAHFDGVDWRDLGVLNNNAFDVTTFNGDIVITGEFTQINGVTTGGTARYDGNQWHGMPGGGGQSLAVYQGQLHAGGLGSVKRWTGSGWQTVADQLGGLVNCLHVHGNQLFIGGSILGGIRAWDGTTLTTPGGGINDTVYCMTSSATGDLIIGGEFDNAGGVPVGRIARWDGNTFSAHTSGLSGGFVHSLEEVAGKLYVGGNFGPFFGVPADFMVRWNGNAWEDFGADVDATVFDLLLDPGSGDLWLGGDFRRAGGNPSWRIARFGAPRPRIDISQPGGPGSPVIITNSQLTPGAEYLNLYSVEPCINGVGTGPYLGLCAANPASLIWQLLLPLGTPYFHYIAPSNTVTWPALALPPLTIEAVTIQVSGAGLSRVAAPAGLAIQ